MHPFGDYVNSVRVFQQKTILIYHIAAIFSHSSAYHTSSCFQIGVAVYNISLHICLFYSFRLSSVPQEGSVDCLLFLHAKMLNYK